ncbi:MAG: hypothetical protein HFG20_05730 [Anaerotruncus sp.]|nr:hypothetical protein [Anaerotruncus sp.]
MQFQVVGREIQQNDSMLGLQGDNRVETVTFLLPRQHEGVDLGEGLAYLLFELPDGRSGYVNLDMQVSAQQLQLLWQVGSEVTQQRGILKAQLKISGLAAQLWHSEITSFLIARSIQAQTTQPVAFFSEAPPPRIAQPETEPPITIAERTINIPPVLQNIAVQNDENSETVTIQMPRYFDGHDLSQYAVFLKTIAPNEMGRDDIALSAVVRGNLLEMQWVLRPPQTSYAGRLQLQLAVIGRNFKWETDSTSVNILASLDAQPVIPSTPSVMSSFLEEISQIAQRAKTSETNAAKSAVAAAGSASAAASSATAAAGSAAAAKASEENAKKSETGAAESLTDIQTGLQSKLSIAEANRLIQAVSLEQETGIFTITRYDGTSYTIDTALEKTIVNFTYDAAANQLILSAEDKNEYRIDMTAFVNIYEGSESDTIGVMVNGSEISAQVRGNAIGINLLTESLQNLIHGKITGNVIGNANQVLFADGQTMQEKLDSGALNGKDGVNIALNGMFYMRVDEFGHLKVGVAEGAAQPPLQIDENGHLIYTIR